MPEGEDDAERFVSPSLEPAAGGAALTRRASILGLGPKPWRRANSLRPSMRNHPRGPAALCAVGMGDIVEAYLMEQIEV